MGKQEFLTRLRKGLQGLPQADIDESITFYSEMIDDRMEEGLSETEAVAANGDVEELIQQIIADTPLSKIAKERIRPKRRLRFWETFLLVLGIPVWLPLCISGIAVVFSLYGTIWSLIISLWSVFVASIGIAAYGVIGGICIAFTESIPTGLLHLAAGLICIGLSIFLCMGCKAVTKGFVTLTKTFAIWIKNCFMKKEAV